MADQIQHAVTGAEYFSLADAGQYEEEIIEGYRGDLDANAGAPPLPHDVYSTRVCYADNWPQKEGQELEALASDPARRWRKQNAKDGVLMYLTWITYTTENNSDPSHDKRERTEVLTTYPNKRGITGAQALLQGLGIDTVALNSHQAQMKALDEKLAGEGSFSGAELDWEATVYDKNAVQRDKSGNPVIDAATGEAKTGVELWTLRGMRKFPQNKETNEYIPEIGPQDGFTYKNAAGDMVPVMEARARNFLRRWVPISKLTKLTNQLQQSVDNVQAQKATAPAAAQRAAAPNPPAAAAPAARPPVRRVNG